MTTVLTFFGHMPVQHQTLAFLLCRALPALANVANVDTVVFSITNVRCLHSFVTEPLKYGVLNATCKFRVGVRLGKLPSVH